MAKRSTPIEDETEPQPASDPTEAKPAGWQPPDSDQEFTFEGDIASAPAWVDRSWGGADQDGPLLHVPMLDYPKKGEEMRSQPYHTATAKKGDTIKWVEAERRFKVEHPAAAPAEPA